MSMLSPILSSSSNAGSRLLLPTTTEETKTKSPYSKYWCFTSYKDQLPKGPDEDSISYIIYQQEQCPITSRKHWQGYVEFRHKVRRHQVQQLLEDDQAHCELRKGTAKQASDYCEKSDTAVRGTQYSWGTVSKSKESVWDDLKDAVDKGATIRDLANDHFSSFLRYNKGLEKVIAMRDHNRVSTFKPLRVICIYGDPGCGKTKYAYDLINHEYQGQVFCKYYQKGQASWWDGYFDQKCILVDDFEGDAPINELLQLLDGYGHNKNWPVKGGFIKINPETVIFTSNHHPRDWYKLTEDTVKVQAVLRRIPTIITQSDAFPLQYIKRELESIEL